MKKNRLTKQILLALAMAAVIPAGQTWAEEWSNPDEYTISEDGTTLTVTTSDTVRTDSIFGGKGLNQFSDVNIEYTPQASSGENRPLGVYSARYHAEKTNFYVHVIGNGNSNNDALHLTNWGPDFYVHDFKGKVEAIASDFLNLSHDVGSDGAGGTRNGATAHIFGDLEAEVMSGNGIRANASVKSSDLVNSITVDGTTKIIIHANAGENNVANPTAVWAGSDVQYWSEPTQKALGKGEITLRDKTTIHLMGKGNAGV